MNASKPLANAFIFFAAAAAFAAEPDPEVLGKIHYDGAKSEPCEIILCGIDPATTTRVGSP
jgi:hypothetical protein